MRDSDVTLLLLPRELAPDPDMPPKPKPSLSDQRQDLVLRRTGEPPLVLPLMWFSSCCSTALVCLQRDQALVIFHHELLLIVQLPGEMGVKRTREGQPHENLTAYCQRISSSV